ncbi:unnamed protein product [[Candida] boidinii]|nr:unnamed protein product [[Candida] boidinii]
MSARYYFENGLRFVKPYYTVQKINVKGRWYGQKVLDVLASEFRDFDENYYKESIRNNNISIERFHSKYKPLEIIKGEKLLDLNLRGGDVLVRNIHKHERPVLDCDSVNHKISIIYQDDDLVVINKPSGIPIHPVQSYYYNSIVEILKADLNLKEIFPCHRLDKLTSGVSILTKNFEKASEIQKKIRENGFEKSYLARVLGNFDNTINNLDNDDKNIIYNKDLNEITCNDPLTIIDVKRGFSNIAEPKEASTVFKRVKYNEELNESIVLCKPITGRTHQIRLHLRNLGHPIVNDPIYGPMGFQKKKIRNGLVDIETFQEVERFTSERRSDLETDKSCEECGMMIYKSEADFQNLYLHAITYKAKDNSMSFVAPPPSWADI